MKRIISLILTLSILTSINLLADFQDPSDSYEKTTVVKLKKLDKGTSVTLTGNIIKKLKNNIYIFKDSTSQVNVKISSKLIKGLTITPEVSVTISGELDKFMRAGIGSSNTIIVDKVEINSACASKE